MPDAERGGPPRHADQPRRPAARAGGDQLRRGGSQPAPRRPGPPGLRQAVPGDRVPAGDGRACSAAAGRAPQISSRSGRSTCWRGKLEAEARTIGLEPRLTQLRPTGRASWAAAARQQTRRRWTPGDRSRAQSVRCSTRSSASAGGSAWNRAAAAVLAFTTAAPEDREQALALADQFGSLAAVDRAFDGGRGERTRRGWRHWASSAEAADLFQRLAAHVLFPSPVLRSRESCRGNRLGQPGLWPHGISGDLPIVLVRIGADGDLRAGAADPQAHAYWRRRGLVADLVLLHDAPGDETTARPARGRWSQSASAGRTRRQAGRRVPARRLCACRRGRDAARGGRPGGPSRQ